MMMGSEINKEVKDTKRKSKNKSIKERKEISEEEEEETNGNERKAKEQNKRLTGKKEGNGIKELKEKHHETKNDKK